MEKIVSQLDADGYFVCPAVADESPLEPGVFLIPAFAIDAAPPDVGSGMRYRFVDGTWISEPIHESSISDAFEPPVSEVIQSPVEKLRGFLAANPDVAALIAG